MLTPCRTVNSYQHFEVGYFVLLQCRAIQEEETLYWKMNTAKPTANKSKKKRKVDSRRKSNIFHEDV
jgi:hypothetical protein